jgi:hypothetical protein
VTYDVGAAAQVYVLANCALVVGYLVLPAFVVPYLSFRRRTKAAWMTFFVGCVGTHLFSVWQALSMASIMHHGEAGWVAALWHTGQAVGTWAAIFWARQDLARADAFLHRLIGREVPHGEQP